MDAISKVLVSLLFCITTSRGDTFDPCTTSFSVCTGRHRIQHEFMSIFVLPEQRIHIEYAGSPFDSIQVVFQNHDLRRLRRGLWWWIAPEQPGYYDLVLRRQSEQMTIRVFVMHSKTQVRQGTLNGFSIGAYPHDEDQAPPPPSGFVEVNLDNDTIAVSPHFRLGDLVWRPRPQDPHYAVLTTELLTKLELVLSEVNRRGHAASTLTIMSGYRTPWRNSITGNVRFSRHQWGQAADLFVDGDGDGMIDDLNRDGKISVADARVLYDIVDFLDHHPLYGQYAGGLGWYDRTRAHTPFVHIDTRGQVVRWVGTGKKDQVLTARGEPREPKEKKRPNVDGTVGPNAVLQ